MKYITVKLTEAQATWLLNQAVFHDDIPLSHPDNAFIMRVVQKIEKALAKAKS